MLLGCHWNLLWGYVIGPLQEAQFTSELCNVQPHNLVLLELCCKLPCQKPWEVLQQRNLFLFVRATLFDLENPKLFSISKLYFYPKAVLGEGL